MPTTASASPRADDYLAKARQALLAEALPQVPFEGWSGRVLRNAVEKTGVDPGLAKLCFPRGGLDLLLYFHQVLDRKVADWISENPPTDRLRDKVTSVVRARIEAGAPYREAIHRGAGLLALPPNAAEGMRALWKTADMIWTGLGDTSEDHNWYTKRAILATVYGATTMHWLSDDGEEKAATWAFLDRRINDVMKFEKAKARLRKLPFANALLTIPRALKSRCYPTARRPGSPGPVAFPGKP